MKTRTEYYIRKLREELEKLPDVNGFGHSNDTEKQEYQYLIDLLLDIPTDPEDYPNLDESDFEEAEFVASMYLENDNGSLIEEYF